MLGRTHQIIVNEEKLAEACDTHNVDADHTTGLFVADTRQIYVSPHQEPEDVAQTLIHETLHAIGHITGQVQLSHSTRKNEAFINAIANGIVDLLKNEKVYYFLGYLLGHFRGEK